MFKRMFGRSIADKQVLNVMLSRSMLLLEIVKILNLRKNRKTIQAKNNLKKVIKEKTGKKQQ